MQLQLHHNRSTNANGTDNFNTGDPHQQQDVQDVQDKEISSEQKSKGDEKRGDDDAAVPVGSNTTTDKPSQTGADTDKSPSTATTTEHYPHSDAATDMDDSDPPFSSPPDEDNHSGATPFAKSSDKDVKSAQDSSEADGVATDSDGNSVAGETENDGFRLSKAEVWTFLGVIVSLLLIFVLICNIHERKRNRQHARYNCVCIVFFANIVSIFSLVSEIWLWRCVLQNGLQTTLPAPSPPHYLDLDLMSDLEICRRWAVLSLAAT